jgi:hypothetical protein
MKETKVEEVACKQDEFICHLEKTTETVQAWPKWKKDILSITRNNQQNDRINDSCESS